MQRHGGQVFGERGEHRIHRLRMETVRGSDASGQDALSGKAIGERTDRFLGAGHHAAAGFVDGGEVDVGGHDEPAMSSGLDATATMAPAGAACISRARIDTTLIAVWQVENPRQGGGHEFADAVSGQRRRGDPVGHDQLRQRVFHREQGRLGQIGGLQVLVPVEHLGLQVDAEFVGESGGAPVEVSPRNTGSVS